MRLTKEQRYTQLLRILDARMAGASWEHIREVFDRIYQRDFSIPHLQRLYDRAAWMRDEGFQYLLKKNR